MDVVSGLDFFGIPFCVFMIDDLWNGGVLFVVFVEIGFEC